MKPRLTTVTRTQGNNLALKDGAVAPQGYELAFEEVPVLVHAFRRMVRGLEFDVCEMAFTTYLCAKAYGKRFTALPIFLVRGFHHAAIVHNVNAGIRSPADLEGRRVGVNRGYTVTTGVWARGILREEYGVDLRQVTWVPSGDEHVAEYQPPENVVPIEGGADLAEQVSAGELAAAVGLQKVDHPDVRPLVDDPTAAGFDALRRTGLYPINHLVVVRDDVLADHPGVAEAVFESFAEAKNRYVQWLHDDAIQEPSATDVMYRSVLDILDDPLPYGIEPNRAMIDKLIDHAVDQGILHHRPDVEALFASGTHELTA